MTACELFENIFSYVFKFTLIFTFVYTNVERVSYLNYMKKTEKHLPRFPVLKMMFYYAGAAAVPLWMNNAEVIRRYERAERVIPLTMFGVLFLLFAIGFPIITHCQV